MAGPRALVLLNPAGGSAGDDSQARVAAALTGAGVRHRIEVTDGEAIADRARRAVDDGAEVVIAAGGDGTVSAVAGALAGTAVNLGVMPLGTRNHFARDLGISFDLKEAAAVIAAGAMHRVDAASLNKRIFINNSALGLYPLMVADRDGQQKRGRSKRLAMIVAGARTLARLHHHRLALTVNGKGENVIETPLLFVGNNDYRLDAGGAGRRDTLSDGHLCVIALRKMGRIGLFAALVRALAGRSRDRDMVKIDSVERLRVASRRSGLEVSLDGESLHLAPPLEYEILPAALRVIAPA